MLISVFTDSHIGYRRFKTESEQPMSAFEEHIDRSVHADVTIHAGDLFDSKRATPSDLRRVQLQIRRLRKLKNIFAPPGNLIYCVGNHEDHNIVELLDASIPSYVLEMTIIPQFYLVNQEILIIYAINHGTQYTLLADSRPFFDQNPQLTALPRTCILIAHENNSIAGKFDFKSIFHFNLHAFAPVQFVVNGHEHESQLQRLNNVFFVQPGTEVVTAIKTQQMASTAHHFFIDTGTNSVFSERIFSSQIVFRRSISYDLAERKIEHLEAFVEAQFRGIVAEIFEAQRAIFSEFDAAAVEFGARKAGLGPEKFRALVERMLAAQDTDLYAENYLFKPAFIVDFAMLNCNFSQFKTQKIDDLRAKFAKMIENDNFLTISIIKEQQQQSFEEVKNQNQIEMSYNGIRIMKDFLGEQIRSLQGDQGGIQEIGDSIEKIKIGLEADIFKRINHLIDDNDDMQEGIQKIIDSIFLGKVQSQDQQQESL
ncbi:Calcineurin-like phosphoesterase domain-containing protein [Spironucleus salmonicida]|uniref:Calcineurin-like phosphoesterase domain-containing protein n=1 Tax=Spironucleus salmonicida TaxID=348837 RepID=V6LV38_9EUKA|nr:Calcineurin-like phosphoesterase domain-containing protein [Spironucleus salmonicida]|eukprot:EST48118.1 Calcineurin-like phosphoesterase domain-containing protein [Spironucleus salmonicida]